MSTTIGSGAEQTRWLDPADDAGLFAAGQRLLHLWVTT
jgi:hypothetical protein